MRRSWGVCRASGKALLAWGVLGQLPILASTIPGFGAIRDLPPGTSLRRAIIPNFTGKPEDRFLLKADRIQLTSQDHARADQVEITLRPGGANEIHLMLESACFDFRTGKISSSSPATLDAGGARLACSGLELPFDDSPFILKGPCEIRIDARPVRSLDKPGGTVRRRLPDQCIVGPSLPSPIHLLARWVAGKPVHYLQMRHLLEEGKPADTVLYCSDGMEIPQDASVIRMLGSGVILSNEVGIASRGGFTVKTSKLQQSKKSIGLMPEWVQSLDGSSGVRGLAWRGSDRRVYMCESLTARYTHSSNSVRFVGGPPVIRSDDGEIRATQEAQYFRIRENGKMMLGPGLWLHRQEVVLDHW